MIVNCCLCASQDPGNLGRPGKTERNRNKEQVCVCSPCHAMLHPSCSTHHTVRSYKFALVVNCLFISCFFRIFMDKRKRGVEVLRGLRRTRNRSISIMHLYLYMPSSLWVFALSFSFLFSFRTLQKGGGVEVEVMVRN